MVPIHYILQNLVQRVSYMQISVGIRGAIVKYKEGTLRMLPLLDIAMSADLNATTG